METLQQKQLQFLNDTVNHFNINNRGANKFTNRCSYKDGCAIGRHLTPELCDKFDKNGSALFALFDQLPKNLQELGKDFLREIQILHDNEYNWNQTGLSKIGKEKVEYIKRVYNL